MISKETNTNHDHYWFSIIGELHLASQNTHLRPVLSSPPPVIWRPSEETWSALVFLTSVFFLHHVAKSVWENKANCFHLSLFLVPVDVFQRVIFRFPKTFNNVWNSMMTVRYVWSRPWLCGFNLYEAPKFFCFFQTVYSI